MGRPAAPRERQAAILGMAQSALVLGSAIAVLAWIFVWPTVQERRWARDCEEKGQSFAALREDGLEPVFPVCLDATGRIEWVFAREQGNAGSDGNHARCVRQHGRLHRVGSLLDRSGGLAYVCVVDGRISFWARP